MKRLFFVSLLCAATGCITASHGPAATATIEPRSGSSVSGTVRFIPLKEGTKVEIRLTGLTPGAHGFHIHEKGDCSAPDAASAGPHFNPMNQPHGGPNSAQHHAGDFGNVVANDKGKVRQTTTLRWMTLTGDQSIVGRAVLVHMNSDDLTTQPAGNAGIRIGCGVITMAESVH
jgi:Cu/Zn superoxide dismutase